MFFTKPGIYTAQYDWDTWVSLFGYGDNLLDPRVPVSHQGGDQYGRWVFNGLGTGFTESGLATIFLQNLPVP